MDRTTRAALDRHLTTEPAWRTGDHNPEEVDMPDQPDPCPECDWVGAHAEGCPAAPSELDPVKRRLLLPLWARYQVETHSPSEDTYGRSCDERGCLICNAGDEAVETLVGMILSTPEPHERWTPLPMPDDDELIDAAVELMDLWGSRDARA